jgi:hypothetical protein
MIIIPEPTVNEVPEKPGIYNLEFVSKDATSIDVTYQLAEVAIREEHT